MRAELNEITGIEKYLLNELSPDEIINFQRKLKSDSIFKDKVEVQRNIISTIKITAFSTDVQIFFQNPTGNGFSGGKKSNWFWFNGLVITTVILSLAILGIISYYNSSEEIFFNNNTSSSEDFTTHINQEIIPIDTIKNQEKSSNTDLTLMYEKLRKKDFKIVFPSSKDTTIICPEGTILKIKGNSFQFENGSVANNNIEIRVTEYYKMSDMLLGNLSTLTKDGILKSAGMIHVEAFSDGKTCKLKRGKPIQVMFPYEEKKEGMEPYIGKRNSDNQIIWKEDEFSEVLTERVKVEVSDPENDWFYIPEDPESRKPRLDLKDGCYLQGPYHGSLVDKISNKINYHEYLQVAGIEGELIFGFTIDKSGLMQNIELKKGLNESLDRQSAEALSCLYGWSPRKKYLGYYKSLIEKYETDLEIKIIFSLEYSRFRNKIENLVNEQDFDNLTIKDMNNYIFNMDDLGWLNCDRLWGGRCLPFYVNCENNDKMSLKAIVENELVIVDAHIDRENRYKFDRLPVNKNITLVALKYVNGTPFMATRNIKIGDKTESALEFKAVTVKELKKVMKRFNKPSYSS